MNFLFEVTKKANYICIRLGGMAEWSNAAVLKTVEGHTSGGSNPSSSAKRPITPVMGFFFIEELSMQLFSILY